MENLKTVGQPVRKKDAMSLLLGKPAYVDDVTPQNCLVVKVLRSPHAHALIEEINSDVAQKVPGVVAVYTYKDVPQKRFTMAGQTYPEPSPYDRLILDQRVRFVGDAVAIVAAEDEAAADKALKLIKVKYQVLEAVLSAVNVEKAEVMVPEDGIEPEIFAEFRQMLGGMELSGLERYAFYDACMAEGAIVLAVSTGEQRVFANILLTIGCA